MRLAICISGPLDFFRESFESLRTNIIAHNPCDLFLHARRSEAASEAIEVIQPKRHILEDAVQDFEIPEFFHQAKYPETRIEDLFWQWRDVDRCMRLVPEGYDAVLRTRLDLIYPEPLRLAGADFNQYWIPRGGDARRGVFDQFAISSPGNMRYYASLYERLVRYVDGGVIAHSETLLKHHLLFQPHVRSTLARFEFPLRRIQREGSELRIQPANPVS